MRLLVTGSRLWDDSQAIYSYLNSKKVRYPGLIIVHGDCPLGADLHASNWATLTNTKQERYPADWERFGRSAGFIRNKEMVDTNPDRAVAFIKGHSRGTKNCISHIEKAGIPYDRFEES